jgi:hypothetical protein
MKRIIIKSNSPLDGWVIEIDLDESNRILKWSKINGTAFVPNNVDDMINRITSIETKEWILKP